MRFQDIEPFTRSGGYMVNVGLDYLARQVERYVWTPEQKTRFVEYMLRGGTSGMDIYINCPTWKDGHLGPKHHDTWCVVVDGKQRLDAVLGFLNNEFPIFGGHYYRDFTDKPRITQCNFRWHVNDLATREECLKWYLEMNQGGTVHTDDELNKVRDLIKKGGKYVRPSEEVLLNQPEMKRAIFDEVRAADVEDERKRAESAAKAAADRAAAPKRKTKKR
jgi:hypothetical protein